MLSYMMNEMVMAVYRQTVFQMLYCGQLFCKGA